MNWLPPPELGLIAFCPQTKRANAFIHCSLVFCFVFFLLFFLFLFFFFFSSSLHALFLLLVTSSYSQVAAHSGMYTISFLELSLSSLRIWWNPDHPVRSESSFHGFPSSVDSLAELVWDPTNIFLPSPFSFLFLFSP